jgi:hypothetical protein
MTMKNEAQRGHMMKRQAWIGLLIFMALCAASSLASAEYLGGINAFVCKLMTSFTTMGYSIALLMFVYGGVRYVYLSDDPGGRKQAMGICIAAIVAILFIRSADAIIGGVGNAITVSGVSKPCT